MAKGPVLLRREKERGGSGLRPRVRGCSQGGITRNRSPGSVDKGTVLGRGLAEYVYLSKARLVDADSIGHACCQTFLSLWQHTRRARRFGPTMTESMREKGMTT